IERGGNYGWNLREGMHDFAPSTPHKSPTLIEPVVEYFREDGQSVTGGLVYRGEQLPDYHGEYFYADYLSGNVWSFRYDEGRVRNHRQVADTGLQIAAFGEDQSGEMFLCAFDGSIYMLRPREINRQQVAELFPRRLSDT